ncbi:MAG: type III secretion system export apparatus subunit SctV [Archangium sp.]|nr:type III secretion system export apparatus subunit SctV [Archangium sp.]MDP3570337.1 type III secretion system export apparatus subunit SctV [Archangium sp.]
MSRVLAVVEKVLVRAKASSDVVLAIVMAMIIGAMIVPLPSWLLDVGLAINLAAAVSLLVAALYAKDALKVATFPTLLLITTLFRLAMNVSSTRLALSEGHAGEIIQAFGEFVVRGDYVVGAVIFAILTLVQFLVVTKGAERVAEVSARFTLDAMPGKQMSIDADLRAGAVTQDQARSRRRALERESQLFGSMDGAMKFVKGDVIAGLVITFINLLGGIVIGVLQNGMTAADAASTYALIAIGDGLVSQIPSLAIAVAAGIVVTRVASEKEEDSLGTDIGAQFFGQHKALFVVAGLCVAFAAMPGMPHFTFLFIAALAVVVGLGLRRMRAAEAAAPVKKPHDRVAPAAQPSKLEEQVHAVAPLLLDLAADLTPLIEEDGQAFVHLDLNAVRERLFQDLGVRVPAFRVRTGAPLQARSYALAVDEVPAGRGQLPDGLLFVLGNAADLKAGGVDAVAAQDALGRTLASVVDEREALHARGLQTRSRRDLLVDHLSQLLKKRAASFLGVQEVQAALTSLEAQSPALVKEALQKVPLPLMTDVLKKLLHEQVSIRNLRAILDALVSPATEGDAAQLAEKCRVALARQISHQFSNSGPLFAWLVDPAVEETLRRGGAAIDPAEAGAIIEGVKRVARQGRGVLLSSPDVRRMLRRLIEGAFPDVAVLTFSELDPELQVRPVGRLVAVSQG